MLARPIRKHGLKAEMNVVPYIDVMLVLLVIFMVTAPMLVQGVQIELPKVAAQALPTPGEQRIVTLSVKADGSYYIDLGGDAEAARPLAEIKSIVSKVLAEKPNTLVFVQGDKKVEYGVIVALMGELKLAGAPSVGLITEPPR